MKIVDLKKMPHSSALVLIDIQNDFLPGGSLAVPEGDQIIDIVEDIALEFDNVILSQDWHPEGHESFASAWPGKKPFDTMVFDYGAGPVTHLLWPDHCVQGTDGADFRLSEGLLNKAQTIIRKGFRPKIDSYSAFVENDMKTSTGLGGLLKERGITDVYFAGLALDYCVAWSALNAIQAGLKPYVILPACRGILSTSIDLMMAEMKSKGVQFVTGD